MNKAKIKRYRKLLNEASSRPWRSCAAQDDNTCPCGFLWANEEQLAKINGSVEDVPSTDNNDDAPLAAAAVNEFSNLLDLWEATDRFVSAGPRSIEGVNAHNQLREALFRLNERKKPKKPFVFDIEGRT